MRRAVLACAVCLAATSACAPKIVPAPVVTSPKFPEFITPAVPAALAGSRAAANFDRGWRLLQAGDLGRAEHEFAAALQVSPAFYPASAGAGYVALARSDAAGALPHFDRALEAQPSDVSALVGRGESLVALNREAEAAAAFDRAVAIEPSLVDLRRRADVLKFRGLERGLADARQAARSGNLDQALRSYQAAIASSPDSAFLYRELAAVERQKGDTAAALEHLRKASALEPTDATLLAQIGELLEGRGDIDGAVQAYASALAIEPDAAVQARVENLQTRIAVSRLPEAYRAIGGAPQVTRADLAALLGVRLASVVQAMRGRDAVLLTDVRNNWAETWIMAVARAGLMDANANHAFQPGSIVRRSDLAQVVSRLLQRIAAPPDLRAWQAARPRFADLASTHLAYPAASLVVASGVLSAADGSFQPSKAVTGAEATAAVERLERMAHLAPPPGAGGR